jgi:hypothetical protein
MADVPQSAHIAIDRHVVRTLNVNS